MDTSQQRDSEGNKPLYVLVLQGKAIQKGLELMSKLKVWKMTDMDMKLEGRKLSDIQKMIEAVCKVLEKG